MQILFFKAVITPLLLVAASLVVRRWGETVGGLLLGLPLTSGPISIFLTLDHGAAFATQATAGSLAATVAQVVFSVAYCRLAYKGWGISLVSACAAFIGVAAILQYCRMSNGLLFFLVIVGVMVALKIIPSKAGRTNSLPLPWWDLPLRAVIIASLVVCVTLYAGQLGPAMSGVLASIPFMAIIITVFAHRMSGDVAVTQLLKSMVKGLLGFGTFFYVLSATLTRWEPVLSYGTAIACLIVTQALTLFLQHSSAD
ncbi:hypothetical protein PQR05_33690 [Paraburkholderia sediminicola]|uniref:hypothetical protein n=1 Tax=Paraburkholderia sediminicola TaxID=458836 RepID=UPI0038BCC867